MLEKNLMKMVIGTRRWRDISRHAQEEKWSVERKLKTKEERPGPEETLLPKRKRRLRRKGSLTPLSNQR
jgi:hypothetical protein